MHSSIIYLKVKRVVIIRQSFRSTSPYQTCRRVLITKFGTTSWYRDLDFLGLGTPFSMYHRVHIKRVPIRLLCRLDVASSRVRGTKQAQWDHGLSVIHRVNDDVSFYQLSPVHSPGVEFA